MDPIDKLARHLLGTLEPTLLKDSRRVVVSWAVGLSNWLVVSWSVKPVVGKVVVPSVDLPSVGNSVGHSRFVRQ